MFNVSKHGEFRNRYMTMSETLREVDALGNLSDVWGGYGKLSMYGEGGDLVIEGDVARLACLIGAEHVNVG